jgi:hypothetical protein
MKTLKEIILEKLMNNVEYVMNVSYIGKYSKMDVYDWIKQQKIFNPKVEVMLADNMNTPEHEVAQIFLKKSDVLNGATDKKELLKQLNDDFASFMTKPRKKSLLRKLIGD